MYRFGSNNSSSVITVMVMLGVCLIAAPAQAGQWSTPVQPPVGCRSTPSGAPSLALNASGAWVIAAYAQSGASWIGSDRAGKNTFEFSHLFSKADLGDGRLSPAFTMWVSLLPGRGEWFPGTSRREKLSLMTPSR